MLVFKHIIPNESEWRRIESSPECTCFHTYCWCKYSDSIGFKSYVIEISETDNKEASVIGYFVGVRKWLGIWMLLAPANGIGTYNQGLVFVDEMYCARHDERERVTIYKKMAEWALHNGIASYIQIADWQLKRDFKNWIPNDEFKHEVLDKFNITYDVRPTLYLDMKGKTEEELWAMQHKSSKYSVNKARKLGLYVRQITEYDEIEKFVEIHYNQLVDVCAKQGMKPKLSQAKSRMMTLCKSLFPDKIIMLECLGKDSKGNEQIMSTCIRCQGNEQSTNWTLASYRKYQKYRPNELIVWESILHLKDIGTGGLNFGGIANYKLKFGTIYAYVPTIYFVKYKWLYTMKNMANRTYHFIRRSIADIRGRRSFK